ncbi:hypothetical protein [Labrys sp. 22185]|uniref:hypothetical protein n=1 Tax=Labrys sp. 22185 TaxID=3453888 RepID=UPI003F87F31E
MQTEAFKMDMDFLIVLRHGQVKSCREQLEDFLNRSFPAYRFGVGADHAGLIGDGEFCILPVLSNGPAKDPTGDAIKMRPYPTPDVIRAIGKAVKEFRSGEAGRAH